MTLTLCPDFPLERNSIRRTTLDLDNMETRGDSERMNELNKGDSAVILLPDMEVNEINHLLRLIHFKLINAINGSPTHTEPFDQTL